MLPRRHSRPPVYSEAQVTKMNSSRIAIDAAAARTDSDAAASTSSKIHMRKAHKICGQFYTERERERHRERGRERERVSTSRAWFSFVRLNELPD